MRAKGAGDEACGLLCEVEAGDAEEEVSGGVVGVDVDGALPGLSGGVVVAETPEAEADADARVGAAPAEDVCVFVGVCLYEQADLERVLVELEAGAYWRLRRRMQALPRRRGRAWGSR